MEIINSPYYVIDYFSKGILYDYIYSGKITERLAKVIFKKIIESFQFLHSKCICHLDIKPNNIIFDNYFWPVIIDFGHAQKFDDKDGKLVEPKGGAERFKAPEVRKKKKINGEKADIFSLGVVLFNLVTGGKFGFIISEKIDDLYKLIVKKQFEQYWKNINKENLSEDFKNLYLKMVCPEPSLRPSLGEILKDPWLNEVNKIDEKQIKNELNEIYKEINKSNQKQITIDNEIKNEGLITRGGKDKNDIIFKNKDLKPTYIPNNRLNINPYIQINELFSEVDFMNSLANEILFEFEDYCLIEGSDKNLKFESVFVYEEENDELEIGDCKMMIELFEYENKECLLEFRRTEGNLSYFYYHLNKIKEIINKKFVKTNN